VLRTRHGASQPVTPSAAYASEAEPPPLLHIITLTTECLVKLARLVN